MVILNPACSLQTRADFSQNTEHPINNGKLEQPMHARFTPAFLNGENPQIVIAVGNVKHRLDTADVFGLTRSLENILQSPLLI